MSGIAGIFYRNNRPINLAELKKVGEALAHRGLDGISYYFHDSIGLVHFMLHDTPESLLENLPRKVNGGSFVITFHGRLDNREELRDLTDWRKALLETTDSDLILAAYAKWKNRCAEHLLGDFAFAIWDENEKKLYCARDHIGVNPFYYYYDNNCFIFASEIKGLFSYSEINKGLNNDKIADFLTCGDTDKSSTFYKDIFRLPPAHSLEVSCKKFRISQYYEIQVHCNKEKYPDGYCERFLELFTESVSCRLRSAYSVGAYLSGGLDSSSIVCVAANLLQNSRSDILRTFSGVFNTVTSCDERVYFQSVLEQYQIRPNYLLADELDIDRAFEEILLVEDEPFFLPHYFMMHNLLLMAKKNGVRIMLDGHDGDSAVSYGLGLFPELMLKGKILKLLSELKAIGNPGSIELVKRIVRVLRDIVKANQSMPFFKRDKEVFVKEAEEKLNPDFWNGTCIKERLRKHFSIKAQAGNVEQTQHLLNITKPQQTQVLEFLERQSSRQQIVPRFPYFDIRLIEFCLSLPASEKFHAGYNRIITRNSLSNILPDTIRSRKTKTNFTPNLWRTVCPISKEWYLFCIDTLSDSTYTFPLNERFVKNLALAENCCKPSREDLKKMFDLIRVTIFCKWLSKQKSR